MSKLSVIELLRLVDPRLLDYQQWCNVGMALHHEGYTAAEWDEWSSQDTGRHVPGEVYRKWLSFGEGSGTVTGGTIFQYAKDQGWTPEVKAEGKALDWDAVITDDYVVIDSNWVEGKGFETPKDYDPLKQMKQYLETLFDPMDHVSYVTQTNEKDGKYRPSSSGSMARTAGQLLSEIDSKGASFDGVFGAPHKEAGAWIRFNPVDGTGVNDKNITDFRYALVESDDMDLEKQNAIIRELELPVAVLMYSGGKSIHAIVKINAKDMVEYKKRVDYLYKVCGNNGLTIDHQNRNPSRLSRMPGVSRGENKQYIIDTHIGQENWEKWEEHIEELNDDLPDIENFGDIWDNMPQLPETIIEGVLRKGHKMMIAGKSKAGKSFMLIQLAIAVAEGKKWLGWSVKKGRVLYINLELGRESGYHRIKEVYQTLGYPPKHINDIEVWNLRGYTAPMDKLVPKLIRRAKKQNYDMVIVDPIYKVLTGDENSAEAMAYFTNQFDKVAHELGASVIYCHHHSKGGQGGKASMDRSSGSGVFARDPDAILDLVELEVTEATMNSEVNKVKARFMCNELKRIEPSYYEQNVGQDDELSQVTMRNFIGSALKQHEINRIDNELVELEESVKRKTAWRIEGNLREFASFDPVNVWFEHPVHTVESDGVMKDLKVDGEHRNNDQRRSKGSESLSKKGDKTNESIESALNNLISFSGETTYLEVLEFLQNGKSSMKTDSAIRKFVTENEEKYRVITKKGHRNKFIVAKGDVDIS